MRHSKLKLKQAISINIKNLRTSLKMTQIEFSTKIGIPQGMLSRFESGLSTPDEATFDKITKALKIEETDLTSHPDLLLAFKTFSKNKLK